MSNGKIETVLYNLLQNRTEVIRCLNLLYEACFILTPKPVKDVTRKENYKRIPFMNTNVKIFNKNIITTNPNV
jgi:hypothetical protein